MKPTEDAGDYGGTCDTCANGVAKAGHRLCPVCEQRAAEVDAHFDAASEEANAEGWTPTAANVNALPEPIRRYIHDLETRCDPAGEVQELTLARDIIRQLEARAAEGPQGLDAERWRLVKCALSEPALSDTAKLVAVGMIANSRDPLSETDIQRSRELAERFGWERHDG